MYKASMTTVWRHNVIILLTITTAAQNEVALSYHSVRGYIFWQLFLLRL